MTQTANQNGNGDLRRGQHVVVRFRGVLDSRPANGIARVRPIGMTGWIAVVPDGTVHPDPTDEEE